MTIRLPAILASVVLALAPAGAGQTAAGSGATFHLPQGDAARGQNVFVDLKCHTCHAVAGLDLPAPVARPPVPVVLGGSGQRPMTDADLLTAIADPSHYVVPADPGTETRRGSLSRMGDFNDSMTVRQLLDLVAFVKSRRETAKAPSPRERP
jgi:mono/diheme cytochrome c family protein